MSGGDPLVGIQSLSISRVAGLRSRFSRFADRFFTAREKQYCLAQRRKPDQHFAARLAAKLAARKMLGTGRLKDFEVARNELGAPQFALHGLAADAAVGKTIRLSISHEGDLAVAITVMVEN